MTYLLVALAVFLVVFLVVVWSLWGLLYEVFTTFGQDGAKGFKRWIIVGPLVWFFYLLSFLRGDRK